MLALPGWRDWPSISSGVGKKSSFLKKRRPMVTLRMIWMVLGTMATGLQMSIWTQRWTVKESKDNTGEMTDEEDEEDSAPEDNDNDSEGLSDEGGQGIIDQLGMSAVVGEFCEDKDKEEVIDALGYARL
jgi:hypothetical protein